MKVWRGGKKTHASSPSTSGKTHEKTCPIQTRRETRDTREEEKSSYSGYIDSANRLLWIYFFSLMSFHQINENKYWIEKGLLGELEIKQKRNITNLWFIKERK